MGRLDKIQPYENNMLEVHDDNISSVLPTLPLKKPLMTCIWDIDGLVYHALHEKKDENGNKLVEEYTIDDKEIVFLKLKELVERTFNNIQKYFEIEEMFLFISGRGNFRKKIYPDYKANRTQKHDLVPILINHLIEKYNAIPSDGFEADDYVYTASKLINHSGIVISVDSDLKQIPGIHYNYQKDIWAKVSDEQAVYNRWSKILTGDTGDNVNFSPGIGAKYAEKNLRIGMTTYQYLKALYIGYLKAWKNDSVKAKENLRLTCKLISLHDVHTSEFSKQ